MKTRYSRRSRDRDPFEDDIRAEEAFTVSFTDFTIILLAFFIFIDSVTTPDAIRQSAIVDALAEEFTREGNTGENIAESPFAIVELAKDAQFEVVRGKNQFSITMPGAELFESGDDILKPEMLPVLQAIADRVAEHKLAVRIEGHTDNNPIQTARFPSNWELSIARATSVLRLFVEQGVPTERLSAAGRAEFVPVSSNETEEGRALNRRVHLHISAKGVEAKGF